MRGRHLAGFGVDMTFFLILSCTLSLWEISENVFINEQSLSNSGLAKAAVLCWRSVIIYPGEVGCSRHQLLSRRLGIFLPIIYPISLRTRKNDYVQLSLQWMKRFVSKLSGRLKFHFVSMENHKPKFSFCRNLTGYLNHP